MVIAWISRHAPLPAQRAELEALAGGPVDLRQDVRPFGDAQDILARVRAMGAEEAVVVAPLSVLDALCQAGLHPLRARMDVVRPRKEDFNPASMVGAGGRVYVFVGFERVRRLDLVLETVTRLGGPREGDLCPTCYISDEQGTENRLGPGGRCPVCQTS